MPTITQIQEQLAKFRTLLRENRATEADVQMNELSLQLTEQLEKEKADAPPPTALTTEQLLLAALDEINARSGNHARLTAILTELRPKLSPPAEA